MGMESAIWHTARQHRNRGLLMNGQTLTLSEPNMGTATSAITARNAFCARMVSAVERAYPFRAARNRFVDGLGAAADYASDCRSSFHRLATAMERPDAPSAKSDRQLAGLDTAIHSSHSYANAVRVVSVVARPSKNCPANARVLYRMGPANHYGHFIDTELHCFRSAQFRDARHRLWD
jgi:hypothetical protein